MITVKWRRLWLSLLSLLLALMLSSCASLFEETPDFTSFFEKGETETETEREKESEPIASRFRLILPGGSSDAFLEKARAFGEALREKTGVDWQIREDGASLTPESNTYDIVLGWADHPQRREWCEDLRTDDYLCRVQARVMVLCGRSEEATARAMDQFADRVLPYAELGLLDGEIFRHTGSYALSEASLNGIALSRYVVVYDNEGLWQSEAEAIGRRISEESGVVIAVLPEQNYDGTSPALILRTAEEGAEQYGLLLSQNSVILSATSALEMRRARLSLEELMLSDGDGDGVSHALLTSDQLFPTLKTSFHVCVVTNGNLVSENDPKEISAVSRAILSNRCEGFWSLGFSEKVRGYLEKNLLEYDLNVQGDGETAMLGGIWKSAKGSLRTELMNEQTPFAAWLGTEDCGFLLVISDSEVDPPRVGETPLVCVRLGETVTVSASDGVTVAQTSEEHGASILLLSVEFIP